MVNPLIRKLWSIHNWDKFLDLWIYGWFYVSRLQNPAEVWPKEWLPPSNPFQHIILFLNTNTNAESNLVGAILPALHILNVCFKTQTVCTFGKSNQYQPEPRQLKLYLSAVKVIVSAILACLNCLYGQAWIMCEHIVLNFFSWLDLSPSATRSQIGTSVAAGLTRTGAKSGPFWEKSQLRPSALNMSECRLNSKLIHVECKSWKS